MRILHLISVVSTCLALSGCATQPAGNGVPGTALTPTEISHISPASTNNGDRPPQIIHAVNAVYPKVVRAKGIVGVVTVRYVVDTNGNVVSPVVMKSPDPRLSKAVLDAIFQWKFVPGEKNGHKVNTRLEEPFTFDLNP
ncbi:MAG TPA: energy transducer TonB [Opitutaceae bacterium]|nr:energy transducer TonB [Opitutaceae bacterium]